MSFCQIPAALGVNIGSENGRPDEMPVIPRNFKAFEIGQFEVTQLQFKTLTKSEPWKENGVLKKEVKEGNNFPADYISYNDAQRFIKALNLLDDTATYRLPAETEWEYAARAGSLGNYYWGEVFDADYGYFWDNSSVEQYAHAVNTCPNALRNKKTPGYCANQFGLFHMLGNAGELTGDTISSRYENAPTDGNVTVESAESGEGRIIRGGFWFYSDTSVSSADRGGSGSDDYALSGRGFRVVRMAK